MHDQPHTTGIGQSVRRVGQVPNVLAASHWIATTPLLSQTAAFVVCETVADVRILADGLHHFDPQRPVVAWDGTYWMLESIHNGTVTVVVERNALDEQNLPSVLSFDREAWVLRVDEPIDLQEFKEYLTVHGYERDTTANQPGRWAQRGEVLDLFLDRPWRVTLHGNRIEQIAAFELKSGKNTTKWKGDMKGEDEQSEEHGKTGKNGFAKTHKYDAPPAGYAVQRLLVPPLSGHAAHGRATLLNYIPSSLTVVVVHGPSINVPNPHFLLEPFVLPKGENAGYREPKAYHLRIDALAKDCHAARRVVAFTSHDDRVKGLAKSVGKKITVMECDWSSRGFSHDASGTLALTDTAIGFGDDERAKQSRRLQHALVQSLQPGDYVVHLFHGIARYNGMTTMHVNALDRDYLVLEYADRDKIYVPVELADRVEKYVGDAHPKLHRLADATWQEAVSRVKAQTEETARELLDLYARRSVARAPQLLEHFEERDLHDRCPFVLTTDQEQALHDVFHDLQQDAPMDRLLCGDVGFGKTEVSLRAAYRAVLNGYQVALLAPTTVLVQQHIDTFTERMGALGVSVAGLSRFHSASQQRATIAGMAAGTVDVVVGTHRLLSRDIHFKHLGLIVIDEEQRFGVKSKEGLQRLRQNVHVLTMTATPIPRTLHLSVAGIRSISTILTPPQARKPVETFIQQLDEHTIRQAIEVELHRNGQTYYLYNRVQSIERRAQELHALVPKARIAVAHGQMPPKELAHVMHLFDTGEIDVLLATTIVENGLDIPLANTLIVEHASMFGLGELYQLKGRVGRSHRQGYAYFLYTEQVPDGAAKRRFIALQEADTLGAGFELALKDMEIRGIGNILGKEQHGHAVRVGMNLYVRLLHHAVQQLNGVAEEPLRDVTVDIPLEARIPPELLPHEADRVLLYQQLASIRDLQELAEKREQYEHSEQYERDGHLPSSLAGLFDVLEIKLLAARTPVVSIDTTYPTPLNGLQSPRITMTATAPLSALQPPWTVVRTRDIPATKARATLDELGQQWVGSIKQTLCFLSVSK